MALDSYSDNKLILGLFEVPLSQNSSAVSGSPRLASLLALEIPDQNLGSVSAGI
jgi:hypothetical protein